MIRNWKRRSEHGQVLVIVAVGMIVIIAMVGLVIDGGYAWGQQRDTQNATDASSEAGAVALAENLPYHYVTPPQSGPNDNDEIRARVLATAATRGVTVTEAWYTDYFGTRVGTDPLIGLGQLPNGVPPTGAEGVEVVGSKNFDLFIGQVIGIDSMTAVTDAITHIGFLANPGQANVLPVTVPLNVTTCTNTNRPWTDGSTWPTDVLQVIPLCSSGPGNVGWLDWTPPGGGTNELRDAILHPSNPDLTIPGWYFVAETGNVSSPSQIGAALNTYVPGSQEVVIPLFDATCDSEPPNSSKNACATGPGNGTNQWYHLGGWIALDLEWVDLNGGRRVCGSGNGSTGCIAGYFRQIFYSGTIRRAGSEETPLSLIGVELIK